MPPMALTEAQVAILYIFKIKYKYFDQSLVCVTYSIHMFHENTLRINCLRPSNGDIEKPTSYNKNE